MAKKNFFYWMLGIFVLFLIIAVLQKIFGGGLGFEEIL